MGATSFAIATPANPLVSLPGTRRRMSLKAAVSTFATESARVDSARKTQSVYDILRVDKTASQTEIKTAYRRLAKVYHPDVSGNKDGGQSDRCDFFIEIRNAYETLSDPVARAVYDLSLGSSRRRCGPVGFSSGYCLPRRWETDQCW